MVVVRKIRVGQNLLGTSVLLTEDRNNTTAFDTPGPWFPANQPGPDAVVAQVNAVGEMVWRGKPTITLSTSVGDVRLLSITQSVIPADGAAPPGAADEPSKEQQAMTDLQTAEKARGALLDIIAGLSLPELAKLMAHEYDDDVAVPGLDSYGAAFLFDARDRYVEWVRREGRFPDPAEHEELDATAGWHHQDSTPSQRAQAFVDLGLYLSHHANSASDATMAGLHKVLDAVAEAIAVALTKNYGPTV
jgi:hypothetical protein